MILAVTNHDLLVNSSLSSIAEWHSGLKEPQDEQNGDEAGVEKSD